MSAAECIPDPIERGEARVEKYIEGDKARCIGCQQLFPFDEVECSTPDPYSAPICKKCINERYLTTCLLLGNML